ncbi:MAG: HD domain-containing protein, partial [Armatimonadetes bacterium]|nr:HD domain-containing protein [Armatimonadota bacterium]
PCYDFPLSPEVEVMISDFASGAEGALDDIESRRIFLQILRHPHRVYATLKRMADLEVLPRVIPAYQALLRLLPTEAVHQFTVGEHSLRVVEALEQSRAESETTGSIFRQAWNHVNSPEVLMLAALLHDVGKIRRSEHHAEVGAEIARSVAFQLGLEEESIQHLAFLVKNHDLLADFTRLRQPDQPGATAEITEVTKTPERLAMLFLLACADVRTMGNDTGVHVQIENLVQLYRTITATPPGESDQTESEGIQEGVRALEESLSVRHLPETAVRSFIAAMPAGYLLNTDVDRIAAHIMAVDRLENEPVVDFREDRRRLWTVMTVIALDAPGLLSKIAGVLFAHDVNVHSARVFTREGERPIALDELVVEAHNKPLTFDVQVAVERDLRRVLAGEVSAADVMAEYGRRLDSCTPVRSVRLHNDLSESFTVVEIEMPDEKGLVCRLATALTSFGWDIHNARITTRAGTARIVFYVTDVSRRKIETDTLDPLMMLTEGMSAAE